MTKKRINKILWYGSDLKDGEAKAPSVASLGNNGLDGINDGELYICNADEDPAIFTKTNKGRAVRVGGGTGNGYTKEEIDTFLGKKLDKSVWDSVFKIHYGEDGSVRWIETLFDLVVDGGITMYGIGDHTASTIMDGILVDGTTIGIVDGKLSVIGDIGGGTANGIRVNGSLYSPDEDGIITIPNYPTSLAWNDITGKPGWIGSTKPSYSWGEINSKPSVFPTDWENVSGKPSWIGTNKPSYDFSEISNKPTTLAGYGITDAYTKDGISELLDGYVTLDGAQDITGVKSFVNGVNIGDILVKKHSDRVVELDGDLIVTGSITIFAQGSHTASTILDALPIDETTLSKEGNKLSVIGGVGGGSVDGIILNGKIYFPDEETKLITLPDYPTSMKWGSITNTPSTLAGYGITDAYTKAESNANYVIKSGDTMTGDLNVRGQLYAGDEQFVATLLYTFIGKEKGIYFSNDANNSLLYVNTHYNRVHQSGSFTVNEGTGVVNFWNDPLVKGHNVLHLGNYSGVLDNRYVNKSGDTMEGTLFLGGGRGQVGSDDTYGSWLQYGVNYINVKDNGLWRNNSYKIWDEGNDGSGSGLDADMLDGLHYTSFARKDAWQANNLNDINDTGIMTNYANADATVERNYPIQEAGILIYGTAAYNSSNQIYGTYSSNRWFARGGGGSAQTKTSWREFAFTDSNVASATKLQTPRSLWGNLFDGTSDLNGSIRVNSGGIHPIVLRNSSGSECAINYQCSGEIFVAGAYTSSFFIWGQSVGQIATFEANGRVGIGVTPDYKLHVGGDIKANSWSMAFNFNVNDTNINLCSNNGHMELDSYGSELVVTGGTDMHVNMRAGIRGNIPTTWLFHAGSNSSYADITAGALFSYGRVQSISNGITSTFGAENSSYCHISTNATAFWFSSELRINGSILPYNGNHWIGTADSPWGYVFSNGWFRSLGNTGWFNQTYDGGIYMTDSNYVRVYQGKRFYTSSSYYDAISTEGGFTCYANRSYSWGNGFGTINQSIPNDSGQTPLIVAYRSGSSGATNGSNRLFSVECLNSGMEVDLLFGGDIQFQFSNSGNFLAYGGITMYYPSDKNLKANIRPVTNASERLMSIGGVYDFEYIDSEVERNSIYAGTHTGLIYQNVKGGVMDCMAYEREDGKGALNYIDPSFISLLAAVEIEHEGRIQVLESENKMLKANNEELMNRINELERRIA